MNQVDLQIVSTSNQIPSISDFQIWVDVVLNNNTPPLEVLIRLVDTAESADLNKRYRQKKGATNILSFPFEAPEMIESPLLGDLIICVPIIENEALEQKKPLLNHWAHITFHGLLHLCGYDHIKEVDAKIMEAKEISLLKTLLIDNPYEEQPLYE